LSTNGYYEYSRVCQRDGTYMSYFSQDWGLQYKKANRSSEKNKKKLSAGSESRLTNDISPESSPGVGRRRTKTPKTYPPTKHPSQFSVPDSAEFERLKQRINFSDLDERSIGSDSHGRATAANNQRPPVENRKPFNFLQQQINSNKSKAPMLSPRSRETRTTAQRLDLFVSVTKDSLQIDQLSLADERGEPAIESSQIVSRLIQIRDYICKARSMRDDLMEKNERSANVERLSQLIEHLKEQEKSYMKFLQKMLARENEEDEVGTTDSAVGSGSVADSTSLNIDVQSEASDATEASHSLRVRPRIEDNLGNTASQAQGSSVTSTPKRETDRLGLNDRRFWHNRINGQEHGISSKRHDAKEELENLKKQHELLKRMLQQQEQLRALQGRQAALLALQNKAEQTIAGMDESVVTETTGSVSGLSITSELNEELNDLIQRFHNQLRNSQSQPVPDNRRRAESLSLTQEVSRSRDSLTSEHLSEEKAQLVNKLKVLQEKKERMDKLLDELHTLRDQHLNNSSNGPVASGSSQRSIDQSTAAAPTGTVALINREPNSMASSVCVLDSIASHHESDEEENPNPREKLKKLKEVHKRLNELRELVDYYQQTSDMMTDAVNENTKEDEDDETEEESMYYSDQENPETVTNIRNPQRCDNWSETNTASRLPAVHGTNNHDDRFLNTDCEINNRPINVRSLNVPPASDSHYNDSEKDDDDDEEEEDRDGTVSSRRSSYVEENGQDLEIQQKINRLNAAKQKLRQLQELVAMVQEAPDATGVNIPNVSGLSLTGEDQNSQQPNNARTNSSRSPKEVTLDEKDREKFYEAKLQQQQKELKQLQEERKRLMEIQEKIQQLQRSCPDLQVVGRNLSKIKVPVVTSTPAANGQGATAKALPDPIAAPPPDNELWSEMRRHQILREELRQRRKQLEALMAEHQRQKTLTETTSITAASIKSDGAETQGTQQLSRTERTTATWGGSTQGALDDDDDEEEENIGAEEEEELETSSHETYTVYPSPTRSQGARNSRGFRLKNKQPYSADGNYRSFPKHKQRNVSMRRQENLRWAADLSYVEEREHWQEQVNQLTRQLEFSTNMCHTLMQDQQALSYLLQTFLTGPYNIMPSNVGSPQVHIIMHQLNQCYTQLAWQQNNVQRLKQMLNDLMHQQQQDKKPGNQRDSTVPPPSPSDFVFSAFNYPHNPLNPLCMPGFANYSPLTPGFNFNPVFPPGFREPSQNVNAQASEQQPPLSEHVTSGKTDYLAFPKPFESNSPNCRENIWVQEEAKDEAERSELAWLTDTSERQPSRQTEACTSVPQLNLSNSKQHVHGKNRRNFEEESLESFSSMPDPVDPTTVTKTFKSRKASAQASLASKDKTPKGKTKKSYTQCLFVFYLLGFETRSASNTNETCKDKVCHSTQTEEFLKLRIPKTTYETQEKSKRKKSVDLSSETGSDFSLFEALRDTIYSEVATLISQNESRPHFLIELFHELQLLNSDYLRQRALYALQDIVTRHLSEKNFKEGKHNLSHASAVWMASNSELTPSESLVSSDEQKEDAEYIESLENASTLSTSSNLEPFANDDLGNTVIHLDKALSRMREYERLKIEAENNQNPEVSTDTLEGMESTANGCTANCITDAADVPCPRIDTQQLDRQIKAIMTEVIPFLKQHMDDLCSPQLLIAIRRMVLTLTQQNDESKEFVKFFHKQLGAILQDSLTKFSGRKLKECGEDLLVEISEILFNELAFFRLMQDLDNSSLAAKQRCKRKLKEVDKDESEAAISEEPTTNECTEARIEIKCDLSDREDDEDSEGMPAACVSISLSKAETQALTNYGSGEDENEDDEIEDFDAGTVDVQTSLQASNEAADENYNEQVLIFINIINIIGKQQITVFLSFTAENENDTTLSLASECEESTTTSADNENTTGGLKPSLPLCESVNTLTSMQMSLENDLEGTPESSLAGSPDTDSPVLVNDYEAGSGNLSQKSDEDDFVKVENLPLRLSVLSEAELMRRISEEEQNNNLTCALLDAEVDGAQELAGNLEALKEPENGARSA
uniref:Pericentriolar material 1 n=1 Tax=Callorhinchus milii TaxID=7868 RepID=A0A4W3IUY4_CALMI